MVFYLAPESGIGACYSHYMLTVVPRISVASESSFSAQAAEIPDGFRMNN
jgi:hypothetical protein